MLKLAIIGGGPSAFYVASRILSHVPNTTTAIPVRVHLFDRLWAPHGLVRYGVAPDHPEVKNCTHKFDLTATDPRFRFFGNINIGDNTLYNTHHISLNSIFNNYSHVLFATGCTLPILHPSLPFSSKYCIPALSIVHWYTQHPTQPKPPPLEKISHVSLIGNGNVSLDVARILLTPISTLSKYDIPRDVLEVLSRSSVKHVSIFGRRGPLEAAFTTKELRELLNLDDSSMIPIDTSILEESSSSNMKLSRQQSRSLQLLKKGSKNPPGSTEKTWSLDFYRSPIGYTTTTNTTTPTPIQLSLAHTTVDPTTKRAIPTNQITTIPTSLIITSLGFHSEPTTTTTSIKNVYKSGWAATGAKGVLASTMINAYDTADNILNDVLLSDEVGVVKDDDDKVIKLNSNPDLDGLPKEVELGIKEGLVVQYEDWKKIDEEEVRRGQLVGKERERMGWDEARKFLEVVKKR